MIFGWEVFVPGAEQDPTAIPFCFVAGLKARDIDILVVNCSLFNPTPSLSAMVVNHFKMRSDILSYNLAGNLSASIRTCACTTDCLLSHMNGRDL